MLIHSQLLHDILVLVYTEYIVFSESLQSSTFTIFEFLKMWDNFYFFLYILSQSYC